jgi:hypothetical protein
MWAMLAIGFQPAAASHDVGNVGYAFSHARRFKLHALCMVLYAYTPLYKL